MLIVGLSLVLIIFAIMVFINVYFRVKVLKAYKVLVQNRVQFESKHVFNRQKMEEEVIPKYPHMEKEIWAYVDNLHRSIRMATVLLALITLFGGLLMYNRSL